MSFIKNGTKNDIIKASPKTIAPIKLNLLYAPANRALNFFLSLVAFGLYNEYNKKANELEIAYERKYGPINLSDNIGLENMPWAWIKNPWPWEYVKECDC